MDYKKLEKILLDKMKAKFPDAYRHCLNFELKMGTNQKTNYRIHLMAFYENDYSIPMDDPKYRDADSLWYYAKTVAECISTCDQHLLEYKKTEKLDLP